MQLTILVIQFFQIYKEFITNLSKENISLKEMENKGKKLLKIKSNIEKIYKLWPHNFDYIKVYQFYLQNFQKEEVEILNELDELLDKSISYNDLKLFLNQNYKDLSNLNDFSCFLQVSGDPENVGKILKADNKFNIF